MLTALILVTLLGFLGLFLALGHAAERERALRYLVLLVLAAADLLALPFGLLYVALPTLLGEASSVPVGSAGLDLGPEFVARAPIFGWLAVAAGTAGLLLLTPPVRRLLARVVPIDPDRAVHVVALHYAVYLTAMSLSVAVFMPALDVADLESLTEGAQAGGLGLLWAQALGFVLVAFLGVGLFVVRDGRAAVARLGLAATFDWRWWVGGTLVALASSLLVDGLWSTYGSESLEQVERLSEALFRPYLEAGLLGALTIGLSAGIGEEILFRGAVQPRFGVVLTSLLFAVIHTQYTISMALLQVFIVGLALGLTRRHANTTTAIGVHATYNLVLALTMLYGQSSGG